MPLGPAFRLPAPEGPHFTLSVLARVLPPLLQWFWCLRLTMSSTPTWPSPSSEWLGNHVAVGTEISTDCFMKLQRSLNAAARRARLPCFGQDFYNRACMVTGRPAAMSVMTRWFIAVPIAGLSPAALTALWAAAKGNEGNEGPQRSNSTCDSKPPRIVF